MGIFDSKLFIALFSEIILLVSLTARYTVIRGYTKYSQSTSLESPAVIFFAFFVTACGIWIGKISAINHEIGKNSAINHEIGKHYKYDYKNRIKIAKFMFDSIFIL